MDIDPVAVGQRIKEARVRNGYKTPGALAAAIIQNSPKRGGTKAVSDEAVRKWEAGNLPPWDKVEQLTKVLGIDTEELLFGARRLNQIREERPYLQYIEPLESSLLTMFRQASPAAQRRIMNSARDLSADDPRPAADFHTIKKPTGNAS